MVFPQNFETKVEFEAIRTMVSDFCISAMGKEQVDRIHFVTEPETISTLLDQTIEFKDVLEAEQQFPARDFYDMREELKKARVEGAYIGLEPLFNLKTSLLAMQEVYIFLDGYTTFEIPHLKEINQSLYVDSWIRETLNGLLDDRGSIKDRASTELATIRSKIRGKEKELNQKIAHRLKHAKRQGWISSDTELTIRDGRQVIPLPVTHKRKIQGLILDESATGQTIFVEPSDVLEITNEIRELLGAERREIVRILKEFADHIRPEIPYLIHAYEELGRIDFIRAKARLSILLNSRKPEIKKQTFLEWQKAKHPLLFLRHQKLAKKVVPLTLELKDSARILVISGPNAGGKSVCLKTVGLLQYMLQCGFPIPVEEGSASGVFNKLFIDIGDEQSLENDLSTYSSHLLNMKTLVKTGDKSTLFLIDEFGTGTEPRLGGAIAETILEALNSKKCFGVITTHYSNLKLLAKKGNGIVNGAMLFDTEKMEPLYELSMGKPGSSFAFEIARKIGFPDELLKEAEIKTGKKQLDFDQQLQQLDVEKRELLQKQEEFKVADNFLSELIEKYSNLKNDLESQKRKIIADAREEALKIIENSNKRIENTIREIRESQAEKKKTKLVRQALEKEKEALEKTVAENTSEPKENKRSKTEKNTEIQKAVPGIIQTGDRVQVTGQDIEGEVLSITKDEIVIGFNSITFRTHPDKVVKTDGQEIRPASSNKQRRGSTSENLHDKLANFTLQLDVRGMRGGEALEKVKHYLDEAVMLNIKEVKILHGKGHGILRSLIHDYLKNMSEVRSFQDEHVERGGHGVTLVILK